MKIGRRNRKWIAAGIAPTLLSVFAAILFAPQAGDGRMEQRWGGSFLRWSGNEPGNRWKLSIGRPEL